MGLNKRILFITGSYTLSGSEIANINVAGTLKNSGANVYYLVPPWSEEKVGNYIRSRNIKVINFEYYSRVYAWKYVLQAFLMMFVDAYNLNRIVKKYEIKSIHISSEHYARIFILYIVFSGKEIIYRMGDAPNTHRALFRWIWKKILFRQVKIFVCVSHYIADKIRSMGCPEEKIRIIYSYPFVRNAGNPFSLPIDKTESNTILSYAGQIAPHKGVDILVEAAIRLCKKYTTVFFMLAGDQDYNREFSSEILEKIDQAGFKNRIQLLGFVEDISGFFSKSDIHLCPSVFEDPMPNVIFEAKAEGIPTVGFKSGGIPELIQHRKDGYLCEKKDTVSLMKGIEYYLDPENLKEARISAKRSLERMGITSDKFRQQWIAVYE
jgi:glycosyltransferase involved in cell wall biosynthesis